MATWKAQTPETGSGGHGVSGSLRHLELPVWPYEAEAPTANVPTYCGTLLKLS